MGEIYKARDTRLDRTVAIKIRSQTLAADPQFRERFDREARTISQLDHPHICALYDVGEQAPSTLREPQGRPEPGGGTTGTGQAVAYLAMQYLEGETLEQRLKGGAYPIQDALTVAMQIADALAAAHKAGIVHPDLKASNIMLTKAGAKLLDFGLAKATADPRSPRREVSPQGYRPPLADRPRPIGRTAVDRGRWNGGGPVGARTRNPWRERAAWITAAALLALFVILRPASAPATGDGSD